MLFITIYQRTIKRRATGKSDTNWYCYTTKTLTVVHHRLRRQYPGAETWQGTSVVTHLFPGWPLPKPIVRGGVQVGVKPPGHLFSEEVK